MPRSHTETASTNSQTGIGARLVAHPWLGGAVLGLLGFCLVMLTLDPSGSYPRLAAGPGITLDESFNVQQGVLLVEAFRAYGLFLFDPINVREVFGGEGGIPYLPDHPPGGRWVLGIAHHLLWSLWSPESPAGPAVTACARAGSAFLYGLTIFLIGATAARWRDPLTGWFAAAGVLLMPRLFAHAHLAALESAINLTYALAVLCLADGFTRSAKSQQKSERRESKSPTDGAFVGGLGWRVGLFPGLMLGLALLTKIQGYLVVPCGVVWALCYWRQRAVVPLLVWGGVGGLVLLIGWPWLWLDPVGHLRQFLGSATERVTLHNFYLGQVFADVETPWHYPWVLFLVTVPVGLQILGGWGVYRALKGWRSQPEWMLGLACLVFPLLLFSTNAAVYDGTRLFSVCFPLWGLFIGLGAREWTAWLGSRLPEPRALGLTAVLLMLQGYGLWAAHPCQLGYYNLLVGGPRGAQRLGLETTYWGDSLTRPFLQECLQHLPQGSEIELAPVLHQFQCEELIKQSPLLRDHGLRCVPFGEGAPSATETNPTENAPYRYVLAFARQADLRDDLRSVLNPFLSTHSSSDWEPLVKWNRQGVCQAALLRKQSQ